MKLPGILQSGPKNLEPAHGSDTFPAVAAKAVMIQALLFVIRLTMPVYEYYCQANDQHVEVLHSMSDTISTWGELCNVAGIAVGDTPADAPVERLLFPVGLNTPRGDSDLKNMGFTKLVKRDTGVYENVTATGSESRYMNAGDASTMPDLKRKIGD